ncbi:MAG: oligosaccharide flippase family protein [Proteobacteria bacterium]|nr:oligosaccharide flippase family protein [Pseudomonadota bacterium]
MSARTVVIQLVVLAGRIQLARLLEPSDFGVYGVVVFASGLLHLFGDAGVGAALIQQRDEPSDRELATVFTFHLLAGLAMVGLAWLAADTLLLVWRGLPASTPWLLRAVAFSGLLSALRVVASIRLERELHFGRLALIDVVATLSFYITAVSLALGGLGSWSLGVALVAQTGTGSLLAMMLSPWRIRLKADWGTLVPLLRFGLNYQLKNLAGFVNGAITPLYAGAKLGIHNFGLIQWGHHTAWFPLRLVEVVVRVSFPVFSRLQSDPKQLTRALGRGIQVCALGVFFFGALLFGLGADLVQIVFTAKWLPAVPILHVYSAAFAIAFLSPLLAAALDAMGRPHVFARLSLGWTALNWIVVPISTHIAGLMGFVYGNIVHTVVGNLIAVIVVRRYLPGLDVPRRQLAPVLASIATAAAGYYVLRPWVSGVATLVATIAAMLVVFTVVIALVDRRGTLEAVTWLQQRRGPGSGGKETSAAEGGR